MNLINPTIPIINTYVPEEPSIRWMDDQPLGLLHLRDFDYNIWYCLFSCHNSFKIYKIKDLIHPDILKRVKAGEIHIALDNALEPFMKSIDGIYEYLVIEEGIPEEQIILMTNMFDAKWYVKNLAQKLNKKPIKVMWFQLFESDLNADARILYKNKPLDTLQIKPYPKKFLNLNRRWRIHRPLLMALLYHKRLLDRGHISFGPCDGGDAWESRWPELMHVYRNDPDMLKLLEESDGVRHLPPMYLDTTELQINRAVLTRDTDQYYLDTYFSVVSETTYHTKEWYPNARFLSEKTFKAIAMTHPFILVSVPGSLEVLKAMGYKTFSPFIDESYDTELDDGKRMIKIVNEIERLCNLSQSELETFLTNAREICEYNYNVLILKTDFVKELK